VAGLADRSGKAAAAACWPCLFQLTDLHAEVVGRLCLVRDFFSLGIVTLSLLFDN